MNAPALPSAPMTTTKPVIAILSRSSRRNWSIISPLPYHLCVLQYPNLGNFKLIYIASFGQQ